MNSSRNKRAIVLLVEDEVLVRWATAAVLREAGYHVLDVERADEALPILEGRSDIAVVFTDINMPSDTDGQALAFAVNRRWPCIGLLVTSGDVGTRAPRLPVGSRFLAKPYSDLDLIAAINALATPLGSAAATRSTVGRLENRAMDFASLAQPRWVSR
jgi:CheY-like chemotaxis protein